MFTIKYGHDGGHRYTHAREVNLDVAKERADGWLKGNGWGGSKPGELRVWIENASGEVVYGIAATRS